MTKRRTAVEKADKRSPRRPPGYHWPSKIAADFTVVRPPMLAAKLAGTAFFLASLPVSLIGGNVEEAAQRFVVDPATYTFNSCLGCLATEG